MKRAVSDCSLTATASVETSASANEPKISRNDIQVEHIRIDSDSPMQTSGRRWTSFRDSTIEFVPFCTMGRSRASKPS
jgi:hypothetical protein